MMRSSVIVAAAAAMAWAGLARAEDWRDSGNVSTQDDGVQRSDSPPTSQEQVERNLTGVSVLVGGGVEGYTGSLAPRVAVGPAWNVIFGFHPSSTFGVELAYTGALNSVQFDNFGLDPSNAADIIRNGGHAALTFALGPWMVQPFALAGVGVNHSEVSQAARDVGFRSTTAGYIPFGGGFRAQIDRVTMDLRGSWSLPFSDDLFPGATGKGTLGQPVRSFGRWNATLNVGGTFG